MKTYLVTGGCGFIGSNFIHQEREKGNRIVNLDNLSYAANPENLSKFDNDPDYIFIKGDICDQTLISKLLNEHNVDAIINFAAESHVDNSIKGPEVFIRTNIMGTYHLLWAALQYWQERGKPADFRFLHVSTDEVFGDLPLDTDDKFDEDTSYKPSSPYSASKASSDHLVHAWNRTYGLPTIITNCSNNYGPHQHHEKLIPHMVKCALENQPLPVYGTGENVRDWIYVRDHCKGIALALENGTLGEAYCFGGNTEKTNLELVHEICDKLDQIKPRKDGASYRDQITFVTDRLGHDLRYAIDDTKARRVLGYETDTSFDDHFETTIRWFAER